MKKILNIILFLLLVLLVVQIVLIAPQNLDLNDRDKASILSGPVEGLIEQLMRGVHLVEATAGEKEWELWADTAASFKNQQKWDLNDVKVILFARDGKQYTIKGEKGVVETETKNLQVLGNVIVESENDYRFTTDEVLYISENRILQGPKTVKMRGPKEETGHSLFLVGDSMQSSLITNVMDVMGNVHSQKFFNNGELIDIFSEKARFSGNTRQAKFLGDVKIEKQSLKIAGPEAQFNYDKDTNMVESVFITGGVVVKDEDKTATSSSVTAFFPQQKYVFTGKPRVVQGEDELRGEEIIFLEGGKRVRVRKANAKVDKQRLEEQE